MSLETMSFLVFGLFAFVVMFWSRSGRSQWWWVGGPLSEAFVLLGLPGMGTLLLLVGLLPWLPDGETFNMSIGFLGLFAMILILWGGIVMVVPRWLYPKWHPGRKGKARKKGKKRGR